MSTTQTLCYTSCSNCGCGTYSYSTLNLIQEEYKLTCTDCGRIIEGERAEEILTDMGIVEQSIPN